MALPSDAGPELIRLEKVTLRVGGRWILPETSWSIRQGQNWLVLGPNGSGKTSLTAALTGEVPVVAGRRWLNREHLHEDAIARLAFETHQRLVVRDIARDESRGFAGSEDPGLGVRALLAEKAPDADSLEKVASRLELDALMDQPLRSLSTGEMRRLLIAQALLQCPRLLILDEPFDGLDPGMRQRLARLIAALVGENLQIVLVTHRTAECLPVMTHYLVLGRDRLREQGNLAGVSFCPLLPGLRNASAARRPSRSAASGAPVAASGPPPLIRLVKATVTYGRRRVLDRLDWCVRKGENWLVAGPNGAGKSTLLRLISGDHLQAYANEIHLFGRKRGTGESVWDIKERIGFVSNELQVRYRLPISGFEVVLSGFFDSVGLFRRAGKERRERARRWMNRLQIEDLADLPFDRMSGGQRRMVLIARAVVKDPDLLILDEPCQGLDARHRRRVLALVEHIGCHTATTLVYTTHHADERPGCMNRELALSGGGAWRCRRID